MGQVSEPDREWPQAHPRDSLRLRASLVCKPAADISSAVLRIKSAMHPIVESRRAALAELCVRFGIKRLEVFGSAARGDFDPAKSDVDLLVEFDTDQDERPLRRFFGAKEALETLFGREIDLVMLDALKNPFVLASVNRSRQLLYGT